MDFLTFKEKQPLLFIRQKSLRQFATPEELYLKELLDALNVDYIFQKGFLSGDFFCIVDFYLPKYKLCIEIDGGYHTTEKQKKRDWAKDKYLKETRRFRVLRLTNEEVHYLSEISLQGKLAHSLSIARGH